MEGKKATANKVIGYWMSEKKRQKLNWSGFRDVCKMHGFDLIKLDLSIPLDDQGPFNIILHKLIEIIIQANRGDEKASVIMNEIERYIKEHPEVAIIDPLDNVRLLLDRYKSYSVIHGSTELMDSEVFTPSFVEIISNDVEENISALKRAGVKFPFVCKPSLSHGSSEAHQMAIIFNERGVRDCKPVSVAQTFINHNAVLYKIYCVGEEYFVVERPSLKNFYNNDRDTIFFCTNDVSKADSTSSLTVLDADDPSPKSTPLDRKRLDNIVKALRKEIGLALLGIDIVIENHTNRYAIIDINSYPGYDGYPNFFHSLMNCITQTIDTHERKLKAEKGKCDLKSSSANSENGLPSPTGRTIGKYLTNCQTNDQDDSGFDTCDSSDEKKKQLTAKVRNRCEQQIKVWSVFLASKYLRVASMVPMIVRVLSEDGVTDVPITPETTCFDVVECCRDPGDDLCALVQVWRNYERILQDHDRPLEILQEWGSQQDEVKFVLRYTVLPQPNHSGESHITRNGMKEQGLLTDSLPDGVELSLWELQEMASRQQQQIESQHQILVAKEQRLRYLKHQEARTHQVAAENERLRRLKERVEAQELKLRKLRALRGQVDQDKISNGTLTSDLDSIRALFNEKEKELSLAVAKVEELTRQLEELKKNGRTKEAQPPASAALELDKLRRELLFRNKLKEQQNVQLNQQRDALNQRQEEINSIDKRITELQDRLQRKRLLNQQLAQQLQYNNNNNNKQMVSGGVRPAKSTSGLLSGYQGQRQNVAAVEPFIHVPSAYHQQTVNELVKQNNVEDLHKSNGYQKTGPKPSTNELVEGVKNENNKNKGMFIDTKEEMKTENIKDELVKMAGTDGKNNGREYIPEFTASKSDPKYQTLPYNTKFGFNYKNMAYQNGIDSHMEQGDGYMKNTGVVNPVGIQQQPPLQQQQPLMTVHSTPILAASLSSASRIPSHLNPRVYGHQALTGRGQPVGGTSPSSSTSSLATSTSSSSSSNIPKANYSSTQKGSNQFQQKPAGKNAKPVSSVAPTNVVQKSTPKNFLPSTEKPSPIYQTSSTKILPVQPQTLGSTPQGMLKEVKGELSPPLSSSTPLGTPESTEARNKKPALPPKPAIPLKPTPPPPPRQAHPPECPESKGYIEITAESLEQALNLKGVGELPRTDKVPFDSDPSRSPTPPPPPPPTTAPPDDATSRRTDIESPAKDEKLVKTNQSSNLVNSNHSGTQINNIINNNCSNINNISNSINNNNNIIMNNNNSVNNNHLHLQNNINSNKRIEMAPSYMFPETEPLSADLIQTTLSDGNDNKYLIATTFSEKTSETEKRAIDELDRVITNGNENFLPAKMVAEEKIKKPDAEETENSNAKNNLDGQNNSGESVSHQIVRRVRKGNLKSANNKGNGSRRVSFDPLALLLDASLEGELELVMKTAAQVSNPSAANDEGITALHNAICAGHLEIVKFLVEFGCDVNAQDSDGWTPLHCAASCNNLAMVRFLVEHGACIFATTLSDHETAAEKCEEDEEGFDGCSEYLYSIQEKLGILNNGIVYAVYDYAAHNNDELSFSEGDRLVILRKGDEMEREWWWSRLQDKEGYTPRNLLGLYPRVHPNTKAE